MKRDIEQTQSNEEIQSSTKKPRKESLYQAIKICPLDMILESANETSEVNNKVKGQVMQEYQRLLSLETRASDSEVNLGGSTLNHELKEQVTSAKQKIVSGLNEMHKCYDQFSFFSQIFINRQAKQQQLQQQQQQQSQEQESSPVTVSNESDGVIFGFSLDQLSQSEMNDTEDNLLAKISCSSTEDEDEDDDENEDDSEIEFQNEEEQIKAESAQQKLNTLKDDVQSTRSLILSLMEKVNKLESVSS